METKTSKQYTISPEMVTTHVKAIEWIAANTQEPTGSLMSSKAVLREFKVSKGLLPTLVQFKAISQVNNSKTAPTYHWVYEGVVDEAFAESVIASIRKHQTTNKAKNRGKLENKPTDLNKVISDKLANKSKANATSKGLLNVPEITIDRDTKVVRFDCPTEVRINNVVAMQNVNNLIFTTEEQGKRIVITASIGDSEVFVRMPNKPLQMYDRYQPGKQSSYIITTQQ